MNNELWKDIEGYEGLYQVSNLGNVKSLEKKIVRSSGRNYIAKEKILKKDKCRGYLRVSLIKNKKQIHKLVHRLVAEAFIPNPKNYNEINHKDENKLNNCVDNLEWCTRKYNSNYGTRCLRISKNRRNKKKINQYDLNGNFIKTWNSAVDIRNYYNAYNTGHITKCCQGIYKQMYGYRWEYANEK